MAKLRITKIISSNGETKRQKDNLAALASAVCIRP